MQSHSAAFYREAVPVVHSLLALEKSAQFAPFPDDWFIVLTDVVGSTKAVEAGRYKDVNAMGATSITAVLNAIDREEIPYVFGGDGATFVLHASIVEKAIRALNGVRNLAKDSFGLNLRVGKVSMRDIRKAGKELGACRYRVTDGYSQALFLGDGFDFAEKLIKEDTKFLWQVSPDLAEIPDTSGLECRWDHIKSAKGETVAVLVKSLAKTSDEKLFVYREILKAIDRIYGVENAGHPLTSANMHTTLSPAKLSVESRIRRENLGQTAFQSMVDIWTKAALGRIFEFTEKTVWPMKWTEYKEVVRQNADYRKFDDMLRLLLSGNEKQRLELRLELEKMRLDSKIVYGTHHSPETLVTCMVLERGGRHCHFVDGSKGGYTLAAVELKAQLKNLQ